MKLTTLFLLSALFSIISPRSANGANVVRLTVPATANPWLAGMPTGTTAGADTPGLGANPASLDSAPAQAPVEVTGLSFASGTVLTFSASGLIAHGNVPPDSGPEGGEPGNEAVTIHKAGAEHGISDIVAPYNSLVGVFLGSSSPEDSPPPPRFDFCLRQSRDYSELAPALKQVFYIGSGVRGDGTSRQIWVPAGAARLFLGVIDSCMWNDNTGSLAVQVSASRPQMTPSNALLDAQQSGQSASSAGCIAPPPGMVAWWPGDGNVVDIVGTNRSAVVGLTGFAKGLVGEAFSFNGIDDEVMNLVPGLSNIKDSFTMEFWAWPTAGHSTMPEWGTGGQRYAIFPDWGGEEAAGAGVSVATNGVTVFEHGNCYMPAMLVYKAPITGWTHIAVVYDNKQPKLYINGVLVKSGLVSSRSFVYPSTWLGGHESETSNYGHYRGLLDEISIYNRALSGKEIATIYAAGTAGKCRTAASSVSGNVGTAGHDNGFTAMPPSNTSAFFMPGSLGFQPQATLSSDLNFGYALPREVGLTHEIEASEDLVHWAPLTNAALYFRDLDSTNFTQRFYRFPGK